MIQAKVVEIGPQAITEEAVLILFDNTATEALKNYSIIQEVSDQPAFDLKEKEKISFDQQEYEITRVGSLANHNLTDIGHVTLVFDDVPEEDAIANGVYLKPKRIPDITEGTIITYG